jgi:hypothetical protein
MPKAVRDDPEQSKAFIEKARELGADGPEGEADTLMRRLAKKGPEPHIPAKAKKRGKK